MVTEFFRDPETFEYLATEVFPRLVEGKEPGATLRLWVVGCSSGQEVYSLAIALLEFLGESPVLCRPDLRHRHQRERHRNCPRGLLPGERSPPRSPRNACAASSRTLPADTASSKACATCAPSPNTTSRATRPSRAWTSSAAATCSSISTRSCRNGWCRYSTTPLSPTAFCSWAARRPSGSRSNLFQLLDKKHHVYSRRPGPAQLPMLLDRPGASSPIRARARLVRSSGRRSPWTLTTCSEKPMRLSPRPMPRRASSSTRTTG